MICVSEVSGSVAVAPIVGTSLPTMIDASTPSRTTSVGFERTFTSVLVAESFTRTCCVTLSIQLSARPPDGRLRSPSVPPLKFPLVNANSTP